jgi:hypothetical protein
MSIYALALWGSAAMMIGVAYSGCDRTITIALLTMAVGVLGGIYSGVVVNHIDIAPNFAAMLMGFTNMAGKSGPEVLSNFPFRYVSLLSPPFCNFQQPFQDFWLHGLQDIF